MLKASGAVTLVEEYGTYDSFSSAHVFGSCRMGVDPRSSVVDASLRMHGVPNLWTTTLGPHGPTGPLVQRTFETIGGAFGAWSPDGSWLAYQCGRGGDTQLCVVDADSQAPARQLTSTSGTNFIGEWTDDDAILFAAKDRAVWNIRSVARESGTSQTGRCPCRPGRLSRSGPESWSS